jgi:cyclohexa-1,5-dienecarbonyl-CoA hydratase
MSSTVLLERNGRAATLTLDRPPLNILDLATIAELRSRVESLAADPPQLLWLRARGHAFSAGVAVEDHTEERIGEMLAGLHGAIRGLMDLPSICIAVVEGHCLGGGMELAAACDMVLAVEGSTFGQPEIHLGCFPPVAAALYPARFGSGRTFELLLTGRTFDAEEAERLGFVTWRIPSGELEGKLAELGERLLSTSAAVTPLLKRAVQAGGTLPATGALAETERLYLEELARTEDMNEGVAAFLEKRPPAWKHR